MKAYHVYIQHYNEFKDDLWNETGKYFFNKKEAENEVNFIKEELSKNNCNLYKNKNDEFETRDRNVEACELCGRIPNNVYKYKIIKFEEIEIEDKEGNK